MSRHDLRNRYPFHGLPAPISRGPVTSYNRRSLRHRLLVLRARVRRWLGV